MLATRLPQLRNLALDMERATEIVPRRWISDEEIQALERRYAMFPFGCAPVMAGFVLDLAAILRGR